MPFANIDDVSLWYDEFPGEGDPILASASSFERRGYPEILSHPPTGRPVFQIQARGWGRSTQLQDAPDAGWLDTWADDVCRVADHLGIDRFVYTGVSHGAGIGWHLARRHPDRLLALVSVVGAPHDRAGGTASSAGRAKVIAGRKDPEVVRAQFEILAGWSDDPARLEAREHMYRRVIDTFAAQSEEEARINQGKPFPEATTDEELAEIFRTIRVPVLILGAMRDGVISPQATLRAAMNVRGAKTVLWEDEGHMIAGESPARLAREVALFLDELDGAVRPPDGIRSEAYAP
ncbi:2-hydroxymuconate semialdehyde hydrolase [Microbacterium oxydans]|uniref:alpha/beta fold hydrolase n=1 Tax=Microbacterium oxydans TaxID=82380 RepID=UPI001D36B9CF|nr:alpha/beta hydrolase [Microbacterium oxydans]CAH0175515.1 2-hydroxymuconate semialdehyde hydrolase [Microbacterium oxydans]